MSNLSDLKAAGGSGKSIDLVASGALSNGDKVILQSDGTVKVVAAHTETAGSKVVYESAMINNSAVAHDPVNNKVVIVYVDQGNNYYPTARVGTVSGTTISFGSVVVINSSNTSNVAGITYEGNSGKMVAVFKQSGVGKARVGTISGTSISFGSAATYDGSYGDNASITTDSNSNKVVIAYKAYVSTSSQNPWAVVGTVSGTSISFGAPTQFATAKVGRQSGITFDSSNNKVVIAYWDEDSGYYGFSIVGTVSGTSISFGSAVSHYSGGRTDYNALTFDSNSNKVVLAYHKAHHPNKGHVIVGTVSGTSISFGSVVEFMSGSSNNISITFDSSANKILIAFNAEDGTSTYMGIVVVGTVSGTSISVASPVRFDTAGADYTSIGYASGSNKTIISYEADGNSSYGTALVYRLAGTNLTSTNFIGTSEGAFADTATATVMLRGGITTTQSSLTIGSTYYVQADGTLSTTAGSPSVVAGQALSATTLLIEGET